MVSWRMSVWTPIVPVSCAPIRLKTEIAGHHQLCNVRLCLETIMLGMKEEAVGELKESQVKSNPDTTSLAYSHVDSSLWTSKEQKPHEIAGSWILLT